MKKIILVLFVSLLMIAPICAVNAETTEEVFKRYEESLMKNNPAYAQHKQQVESELQPEVNYYEKLKTCTPATFEANQLAMQTYGLRNGMCSFDLKIKTHQMTKVLCNINAPISEVKQFAENKIKMADSLTGSQRLNSTEYTNIMNQLTLFSNKYCK